LISPVPPLIIGNKLPPVKTTMRFLQFALIAISGFATLLSGQVEAITGVWRQGDPINNQACTLLSFGRIAMNETRHLSTEDLAKRCSTGLRLTMKGEFEEPTSIVVLIQLKSFVRLEGIPLTGWREYWFVDTSALTVNRVTKILELVDSEKIAKVISESPLWNLKTQREIADFELRVLGGYNVEVELFSGGRSKSLQYSNPDEYEQVENLQFRAGIHKLLSDLKLSSDKFVYGLNDLKDVELPSAPKNHANKSGPGQPATSPQSDLDGGDKPKPESEGRSR
jgi:hypothetical protein